MIRGRVSGCLLAFVALACSGGGANSGAGGGNHGASGGQSASSGGTTSSSGAPGNANGGAGTTSVGSGGANGGVSSAGARSVAGATSRAGASNTGQGGSAGRTLDGGGNGGLAAASGSDGHAGSSALSGAAGKKSPPTPVKDLPQIKEMPDPLTMNDGTKVTTPEQWQARRQEMIALLEDYEYGHMPPPPGNVRATTTTDTTRISVSSGLEADYRMLHLTFGPDAKLGFDLGIFTPAPSSDTPQQFPILISLTSSTSQTSLGAASAALARGYAVATVPYQQLGADATNWASTAFFPAYPDYDWRDFSAWAWGISRAVDYLVTDAAVDASKIMITGVSRLGQAVLLAGAFDERIALSAPVAAGAAFRFSGQEMGGGLGQGITEVVDQNTYWFGPVFPQFKNQTPRLPSDQHWLPALTAPRLYMMCNSLQDQYGRAYAAVQTYAYAKPVYQFLLGSDQNIGVNFREGTHGMTAEDWSALLDFADQNLRKKPGTRTFDVLPPADELP